MSKDKMERDLDSPCPFCGATLVRFSIYPDYDGAGMACAGNRCNAQIWLTESELKEVTKNALMDVLAAKWRKRNA